MDWQTTTAWVIERHFDSILHYWTGRPKTQLGAFSSDPQEAMRFARRQDATAMLTWHCEGIGNVVEHGWSESQGSWPTPKSRTIDTATREMTAVPVITCGGTGFIAIPPSSPGPPEGECCPGCPQCEPESVRTR